VAEVLEDSLVEGHPGAGSLVAVVLAEGSLVVEDPGEGSLAVVLQPEVHKQVVVRLFHPFFSASGSLSS